MNAHSSPPGGWHPPEPPWMPELRKLVADANQISKEMGKSVVTHIRLQRRVVSLAIAGSMIGYWLGQATAWLLHMWVGQ